TLLVCISDVLYSYSLLLYFFLFFLSCHLAHRVLHSFPTRRSSDLIFIFWLVKHFYIWSRIYRKICRYTFFTQILNSLHKEGISRSEEHTSELQSRFDLVCRLLLEKKKNNIL